MFFCIKLKKFAVCAAAIFFVAAALIIITANGLEHAAVSTAADNSTERDEVFVPVIMYHSLLKDTSRAGDYVLSPEVFKSDMQYLMDNGYTTVFISELVDYVEKGTDLPEKPVVVTFDDGYYNVMTYAYPFMKENGLKGVMNVVGKYTELSTEQDEHNPAYSSLTWNEISELYQSGVFEIGNHTYDMHSMTARKGCKKMYGENDEEYRKSLYDDVAMLQGVLADKSGVIPVTFAYPFGLISDESVDIFREMG
ncbi:MAG: polysaccharide deacetylase family protein, partial [Oscillospiraceae bacterium]